MGEDFWLSVLFLLGFKEQEITVLSDDDWRVAILMLDVVH